LPRWQNIPWLRPDGVMIPVMAAGINACIFLVPAPATLFAVTPISSWMAHFFGLDGWTWRKGYIVFEQFNIDKIAY
jgi:hypothetical protein